MRRATLGRRPGARAGGTRRDALGGAALAVAVAVGLGMLWVGVATAAAEDPVPDLPPGPAVPIQDRIDYETRRVIMLKNFLPELKVRAPPPPTPPRRSECAAGRLSAPPPLPTPQASPDLRGLTHTALRTRTQDYRKHLRLAWAAGVKVSAARWNEKMKCNKQESESLQVSPCGRAPRVGGLTETTRLPSTSVRMGRSRRPR